MFDSTGVYVDTIPNAVGCDSLITIDLTVHHNVSASMALSSCGPYTAPGGEVWATSGVYVDTVVTAAGCDSVLTVTLDVLSASSATLTESACETYTAPSGQVWTASGTYTDIIPNAVGCDSVITVDLSIETHTASAVLSNGTLTASPAGSVYQWIDCATGLFVPLATGQTFTPTVDGSYAVWVLNTCLDTSACVAVTVSNAGLQNTDLGESFVLFPNPSTGEITLQTDGVQQRLTVEIVNNLGQVILSKQVQNTAQVTLFLEAEAGIYYVVLTPDSGKKRVKPLLKK